MHEGTLVLTPSPETRQLTPMDLLQVALSKDVAIDVIERLMALQREERDYQARASFDEALSRCQERISRVAPNQTNGQTSSKYADYKQLDRIVRPIYTQEGFAVQFTERDCPIPGKTRFIALLSRSGVVREYQKDLTPSTKGPKGNDVMTPIHADGSADSYAKRYLIKNIFNVAIGEDDDDGNLGGDLKERIEFLQNASTVAEATHMFKLYYPEFKTKGGKVALIDAYEATKKRLKELE